jgi:hypothetical protein
VSNLEHDFQTPQPNKADVMAHLTALFPPAFVHHFPDALIEIAYGMPGNKPNRAELFSAFKLEAAADFAIAKNRHGCNVYVGPTLKRGDTPPFARTNDTNVLAGLWSWADLDANGDFETAGKRAMEAKLKPGMIVTTGTVPHVRAHVYCMIEGGAADGDELRRINESVIGCLGGDAVQNPSRILRLAGTVNYPSSDKCGRGYVVETVTVRTQPKPHAHPKETLAGLNRHHRSDNAPPSPDAATDNSRRDPFADPFWGNANSLALEKLELWVRQIFPNARFERATKAWRVSSRDLGRDNEEDLSLSPKGIKDWGVWDVGDARKGRRSAIDIVKDYGGKRDEKEAAFWLCERCGVDPAKLGWRGKQDAAEGLRLEDFYAYMPMHSYIFAPSRALWPAASVNARIAPIPTGEFETKTVNGKEVQKEIKINANAWLDRNRPVEQMTWSPGDPELIKDRLMSNGGWFERKGVSCFNLYMAPIIKHGDPKAAAMWVKHIHRIYPDDAAHIIKWLAHRVQRPAEKLNHALVLGGNHGIGKDTLLEPVKQAVGPWNFKETKPQSILGRFNGFLKAVILRINEARDLGDFDRFSFYEHMKDIIAAPPDVLVIDEKHAHEYCIPNLPGVVYTTNHRTDGIYLPPDDRRHYVAWSDARKEDFDEGYWNALYKWYGEGGHGHVAAYLATLDLSKFDSKAPPPKTPAFLAIVDAHRNPEESELSDVFDAIGNPKAVTLTRIIASAPADMQEWLKDRRHRRMIPHRLESCGYIPVRNDGAEDGLWKAGGKRQAVYAKEELSVRDRIRAAQELCRE